MFCLKDLKNVDTEDHCTNHNQWNVWGKTTIIQGNNCSEWKTGVPFEMVYVCDWFSDLWKFLSKIKTSLSHFNVFVPMFWVGGAAHSIWSIVLLPRNRQQSK